MQPEISSDQASKQAPIETLPPKPIWKSKILWGFVIISTLIAFIAGGIFMGNSKKSPATPTFPQTTEKIPSSTSVEIKELGIKMNLSEDIKDLIYSPKTVGDKTYVYLSTTSLMNAGAKDTKNGFNSCTADLGPLGSFSKVNKAGLTDDPNQPWWNRLSGLEDATKIQTVNGGIVPASAKEFPNFFILYTSPQATCSDNKSTQELEGKAIRAITDVIPTIELIQ